MTSQNESACRWVFAIAIALRKTVFLMGDFRWTMFRSVLHKTFFLGGEGPFFARQQFWQLGLHFAKRVFSGSFFTRQQFLQLIRTSQNSFSMGNFRKTTTVFPYWNTLNGFQYIPMGNCISQDVFTRQRFSLNKLTLSCGAPLYTVSIFSLFDLGQIVCFPGSSNIPNLSLYLPLISCYLLKEISCFSPFGILLCFFAL